MKSLPLLLFMASLAVAQGSGIIIKPSDPSRPDPLGIPFQRENKNELAMLNFNIGLVGLNRMGGRLVLVPEVALELGLSDDQLGKLGQIQLPSPAEIQAEVSSDITRLSKDELSSAQRAIKKQYVRELEKIDDLIHSTLTSKQLKRLRQIQLQHFLRKHRLIDGLECIDIDVTKTEQSVYVKSDDLSNYRSARTHESALRNKYYLEALSKEFDARIRILAGEQFQFAHDKNGIAQRLFAEALKSQDHDKKETTNPRRAR